MAAAGITAVFVAAFFGLRALPDAQCGFLHYVEIERPDGSIEFCATNHAGFVDFTRLSYPVRMEVSTTGEPRTDRETEIELEITTRGGMPIAPHELAITHTEKLHVMIVDPSLDDYYHVHPEPVDRTSGRYRFTFTPRLSGSYRIYAEMVPVRSRRQVIADAVLEVPGRAGEPEFRERREVVHDGLQFELAGDFGGLRPGRDTLVRLEVRDPSGGPAALETLMGAKAHMVAFDHDAKGLAHMHPLSSVAGLEEADSLEFMVNLPYPGDYRVWAQVKVDGRERFAPIDLRVPAG